MPYTINLDCADSHGYLGNIIYSDEHVNLDCSPPAPGEGFVTGMVDGHIVMGNVNVPRDRIKKTTALNQMARIPILGSIAGVVRCILSLFHILAHLGSQLKSCCGDGKPSDHKFHAAKGCTEFLRGLIEIIPFLGTLFCLLHDATASYECNKCYHGSGLEERSSNHIYRNDSSFLIILREPMRSRPWD